jgi:hypothetical protein
MHTATHAAGFTVLGAGTSIVPSALSRAAILRRPQAGWTSRIAITRSSRSGTLRVGERRIFRPALRRSAGRSDQASCSPSCYWCRNVGIAPGVVVFLRRQRYESFFKSMVFRTFQGIGASAFGRTGGSPQSAIYVPAYLSPTCSVCHHRLMRVSMRDQHVRTLLINRQGRASA